MKKSQLIIILIIAIIIIVGVFSIKPIKKKQSLKRIENGISLYKQEMYEEAIPQFEKAIKLNPEFIEAYVNLAKSFLATQKHAKAFATATEALKLDKNSAELNTICGQVKIKEEAYDESIEFLNKAIQIDSTIATAYYYRGIALANLGDLEASLTDYKKAQMLDKNNPEYYEGSVLVRTKLDDYSGIIKDYDRIIELSPDNTEAFYQRGYFKLNLDDHEGAIKDFNSAIELDPKMGKAHYYKGLSNAKAGNLDDAIESFDQSAKLAYKAHESLFNVGLAYLNQNKSKLAREALRSCINADKNGPKAMDARNNLGALELMNSNFESAVKVFSDILKLDEKNTDALFNRAYAFYSLQKYKEAIPDLDKCISLGRTNPKVYFLRGVQYIAQNKFKVGCADLQEAANAGHAEAKNMMKTYCGAYQ